jgi:acetyl-CoA carboxylase biotin carboxyl carrier protein
MKLMNSVPAGVSGTVAEICQVNGAFVEQDAVLVYVKP